jgi:hypothetical protein
VGEGAAEWGGGSKLTKGIFKLVFLGTRKKKKKSKSRKFWTRFPPIGRCFLHVVFKLVSLRSTLRDLFSKNPMIASMASWTSLDLKALN